MPRLTGEIAGRAVQSYLLTPHLFALWGAVRDDCPSTLLQHETVLSTSPFLHDRMPLFIANVLCAEVRLNVFPYREEEDALL